MATSNNSFGDPRTLDRAGAPSRVYRLAMLAEKALTSGASRFP